MSMLLLPAAIGSPPQVRGKRSCHVEGDVSATDHPRRCGENTALEVTASDIEGSPPQVRGKPLTRKMLEAMGRITPAGAGKTVPAMQGISPI